MRTVEKAHIEDQIGVPWRRARDVTKTRRLTSSRAKQPVNGRIKSAVRRREVSITRSAVAQGQNHLTLEPGLIRDRTVPRAGGPLGLHIAPFEALVTTVDVDHCALAVLLRRVQGWPMGRSPRHRRNVNCRPGLSCLDPCRVMTQVCWPRPGGQMCAGQGGASRRRKPQTVPVRSAERPAREAVQTYCRGSARFEPRLRGRLPEQVALHPVTRYAGYRRRAPLLGRQSQQEPVRGLDCPNAATGPGHRQ
jgi:hypothetical protein